ncbi:uncharacterized protein ATC70_007517 [Mucor velutinosus]|uniref:PHD-type domain-containing protein n=1 Tax=Mucor velutinosus TaxID=708070 RepID=A0AAN7HVZ5_9FUNG|nr:hypothetical protein ATC70_007517 [Mucor velutinosus]
MTDNVCHSILKTATQQIIQSAGFEAANSHSIDTLTDIFGQYIELLGSTVSAYANLNGRTLGTPRDLVEALEDVSLDAKTLKVWLEDEGKALSPCWSAQSDPGRLLQGVVNGGKPSFEDMIEYKFGDVPEFDIPSPESSSPMDESPASPPHAAALPDYVPSYFPPFPEIKEDTVMDEVDKVLLQKQQLLEEQKQQQQLQQQASGESLPLPVIVKKRKKPIENPFTHIIPYEDSSLAQENEEQPQQPQQPQQKPLSLLIKPGTKRSDADEEESAHKRKKAAIAPLTEALEHMKTPDYKLGEGLSGRDELFMAQTQNAAAPGNYLFNHDSGVFDELVRHVAEPLVISKLTAPNLLIDVATTTNGTAPATPTSAGLNGFEYGSPGSMPTSPDGSRLSRSASMLAVLAGGASSKKAGMKKLNKLARGGAPGSSSMSALSNHTISKHSVDINAIKTGDSKYIIKKKRMLAEQQQALERQKMLEQMKENPNAETISALPSSSSSTSPSTTTTSAIPSLPLSSVQQPQPSSSSSQQPLHAQIPAKTGPISLSSFSSASSSSTKDPSIEKKKKHKKTPNLMLNFSQHANQSFSGLNEENVPSPSTPKIRFKIKPPEQQQQSHHAPEKPKASKYTKLTTHISQLPSVAAAAAAAASSSSSPASSSYDTTSTVPVKLEKNHTTRHQQLHGQQNLLPPNPQRSAGTSLATTSTPFNATTTTTTATTTTQQRPFVFSTSNFGNSAGGHTSTEEIRCICENPRVDYGTFMIACDGCSTWFHGDCVGIAESDQVEEWYCRRCRKR